MDVWINLKDDEPDRIVDILVGLLRSEGYSVERIQGDEKVHEFLVKEGIISPDEKPFPHIYVVFRKGDKRLVVVYPYWSG